MRHFPDGCQAAALPAACRVLSPAMSSDPQSVRKVVGENARKLRESVGASQDDVAAAARAAGLRWSRSRVAALERGEKSIDVAELVLLAHALGRVTGEPARVADLLDGEGAVELSPTVTVHRSSLARYLGGEPVQIRAGDVPGEKAHLLDAVAASRPGHGRTWRLAGPEATLGQIEDAEQGAGEAEERAGRTLGVSRADVAHLSAGLWGRAMTAERDHRVGDAPAASRAQLRGRVTRQLVTELRAQLEVVGGV